jgi:hypothetical protein
MQHTPNTLVTLYHYLYKPGESGEEGLYVAASSGSVIGAAVLLSVALLAGFGGGFAVSALDAQTGPVLRRYASADEFQRYLRDPGDASQGGLSSQ